jgi:ATP-dependent helicase HrpB
MASGRAVTPMEGEPLASAPWIVVADAAGSAAGARLLSGAAIDAASVERLFADRIESRAIFAFDPASGGVTAESQRRLGAIMLGRSPAERPDPVQLRDALVDGVRQHGLALLPWGEASAALRARITFARQHGMDALPDVSDAALVERLSDWLAPLLVGKRKLGDLTDAVLCEALAYSIDWGLRRQLDSFAPTQFTTPAGSHHSIDYAAEAGPTVAMRVQTLFGLAIHPTVAAGRVPLTLALTSPAGRPIQVTTDLPRFWAGSWAEVRRELRGRYPKHPWPENPAAAPPTLRAKRPGQQE